MLQVKKKNKKFIVGFLCLFYFPEILYFFLSSLMQSCNYVTFKTALIIWNKPIIPECFSFCLFVHFLITYNN